MQRHFRASKPDGAGRVVFFAMRMGPPISFAVNTGPDRRSGARVNAIGFGYSITSSARVSRVAGDREAIASAVLELITNSNLLGRSIGRSAGSRPRSTLPPALRTDGTC